MQEKKKHHCVVCKFVVFAVVSCSCVEAMGGRIISQNRQAVMWEKSTFHYPQHFELNEKEIGWSHFVCKRLTTLNAMTKTFLIVAGECDVTDKECLKQTFIGLNYKPYV